MDEAAPILIDAELSAFLESAVMIIIGTCDDDRMPQSGRRELLSIAPTVVSI